MQAATSSAKSTGCVLAPLPLPTNPATACGPAVTIAWSQQYPSCPRAILGNSVIYNTPEIDPDDECCAGTLKFFGSNSTMSSRNCFCVPSVYERFTAGLVDVAVGEYFGVCTLRGYPIPVYEAGTGACSGAPYNTSALFSTVLFEPEHLAPQKTLHQWLKDLHKDSLILTSFVFGLIAAIGFGGGIWIFCFNLVRSLTTRKHK
ncbi:hypothetical protein WJX79_004171 [Trebouxia sp. C0005]